MYVPTSDLQRGRRRKPKVSFTCTFPGINGHNQNTQLFPLAGPALACGSSETAPRSRPHHILGKGEYHAISDQCKGLLFAKQSHSFSCPTLFLCLPTLEAMTALLSIIIQEFDNSPYEQRIAKALGELGSQCM